MNALPPDARSRSALRRVAADTPMILGSFVLGSIALGYGVFNPVVDLVGIAATGTGFEATRSAIERVGRHLG